MDETLPDTVPAADGRPELPPKRLRCSITGKDRPRRDLIPLETLRPALADRIRNDHPDLAPDALVSRAEVARYRARYVEELLQEEHGEFSELDREVAASIAQQDTIAENVEEEFDEHRSLGERVSELRERLEHAPKSRSWRLRAKVGRRKRWYEVPEEVVR